ncbi:MAG: transposase [candidate division SR1 bacterium]|nr:transposase [candidate division SR1 bacterium]
MGYVSTQDFHHSISLLRSFFLSKGYLEVHTQDRLSILAACEDPDTIATFEYQGQKRPLPQTGQMWLEYELLTHPEFTGVFCVSTSYRQEPNPIPGRHETIFPMFEFEARGDMNDLIQLEKELLVHLGFGVPEQFSLATYQETAELFSTKELTTEHEMALRQEHKKPVHFITYFPEYTHPFWNMKRSGDLANKTDVILCGMETIGSAQREVDPVIMRERFYTISNGGYAQKLFDHFGKERVEKELEEFLSHGFFPRYGGGIGMTRLIRALKNIG